MPDVALEAMEALLVLHQPEKIEMWNPEAPINTFWDVSSQVHLGVLFVKFALKPIIDNVSSPPFFWRIFILTCIDK
jgi:hypothetical protein